ncbi:MAG: threonine--tRNA ligase [Deltaproteobacteria bacterium]|nr:threonine--tRNA ligase [Deltaproteobacteria bacterium]
MEKVNLKKNINILRYVKENKKTDVIVTKVDGKLVDLNTTLDSEKQVELLSANDDEGLQVLRHSTAHVMAQAIKHIYKNAKFAIGPATDSGFFYDIDIGKTLTVSDLLPIEDEMKKIVEADYCFQRKEISKEEALNYFKNDEYKIDIIKDIKDDKLSIYTQGDFTDLCKGPHVPSTSFIKNFKLLSVSGAYFKGIETGPVLQRIYGACFATIKALNNYLHFLEEVKKRDHRRLGKELDLFHITDEIGAGFVIWHPKGAMLRHLIEEYAVKEHLKKGYELVKCPEILRSELWKKSGHYDNYRELMYFTRVENQEFGIKPMNCLGHISVYASKKRSYKELPKRYFELGIVHRHEKSGVLHGLLRLREFTQDDAHIFCKPDQLQQEIIDILDFIKDTMDIFKFDFSLEISTQPKKYIGSEENWQKATQALQQALEKTDREYQINEGEGAFYGPKIDIKLKDALHREWQCATIQCDFALPERFKLTYIDKDGEEKRPVMVHRVILGSIERFIAILIEHFVGDFPLWIAPVQARVLPLSEKFFPYGKEIYNLLSEKGVRMQIDLRDETLSKKIREAEKEHIPFMCIVGEKETQQKNISIRKRKRGNMGNFTADAFLNMINEMCRKKIS